MTIRARPRPPRGNDSWRLAIVRARESWDDLTGGPGNMAQSDGRPVYSEAAAVSILATALGIWADTAAELAR